MRYSDCEKYANCSKGSHRGEDREEVNTETLHEAFCDESSLVLVVGAVGEILNLEHDARADGLAIRRKWNELEGADSEQVGDLLDDSFDHARALDRVGS